MFRLLRHFSVMSALAIAAITSVLVIAFYWTENRNLARLAEDRNISQAYAFASSVWPTHQAEIAGLATSSGDEIRASRTFRQIHDELRRLSRDIPVLKIRILHPSGNTVYSSDPRDIGVREHAKSPLAIAVSSRKTTTSISRLDVLSSFGRDFRNRQVAESHVPILDDSGGVQAVFGLHTDITVYADQIQRELWNFTAMLVGALATLYVVLLLVVYRADSILVGQYRELATFSQRLEERVDERTRQLLNQQSVLSWIAKSEEFRSTDFSIAIGNLTRVAAATLGVERVSVWLFSPARDQLRCLNLFSATQAAQSTSKTLEVERFPVYFEALNTLECIAADDAVNDPRLSEFRESYLKPQRISSMLDVPIVQAGHIEGVLCVEQVGPPIKWTAEHRLFAIAIASFASLALERLERLKVEEDLREANRSVEAANRAKSLFLANMSHEIRTPMNGVFGMTDLLMRTELTERQRKFVGVISGSAKRLLTIINDILDLSRIESGKLELDAHDFDFRDCIEETVDLLAGEAQRKQLDLSVFIASDIPQIVVGDSGRLRQVLTNLVSNAIKFTAKGEVAIRIECGGSSGGNAAIRIEVRDTGIGIPDEIQRRLFMPFQQADTSISRRFGGTGLGLSISRHLVELMGGNIELESELERGTRIYFTICLPVRNKAPGAETEAVADRSIAEHRILVVDDRPTNREVIQTYLTESGARTTAVASSAAAYDEMARAAEAGDPYELAVVDMVMPDGNGLELAHMLRANPRLARTSLVMLTSLSWKGDARVARELGFGAFLTKPVHREELIRTVAQQLPNSEALAVDVAEMEKEPPARPDLGLKVLVAEDNPINLEVAREYLTALGCEITAAANGREAIDAIRGSSFDIVLMDCQMPEMDGLTATRLIREMEAATHRRPTVIIAVTANAFAEDRSQCLEAGMDDYMSKPFGEDQLCRMLTRWGIDGRRSAAASPASPSSPAQPIDVPPADTPLARPDIDKALDREMLQRMQKTHPALLGRLIDTYMNYAPKAIQQLMAAIAAEDNAQLKTTAHSLKSSSANIGASHLSSLCRDLENRLKTATEWDSAANVSAVTEIEQAFQAVVAAMRELKAEIDQAKAAAAPAKTVVA